MAAHWILVKWVNEGEHDQPPRVQGGRQRLDVAHSVQISTSVIWILRHEKQRDLRLKFLLPWES